MTPTTSPARTHPATSGSYSAQANTRASTTVDALGRAITHVQRLTPSDDGAAITTTSYDIDGNITSITDPLGRVAATSSYDCLKRSGATSLATPAPPAPSTTQGA